MPSFLDGNAIVGVSPNQNESNTMLVGNETNRSAALAYGMQYFVYKLGRCVKVDEDINDFLVNVAILQLIIAVFGFLGAILTVFITSSKKLRSSTCVYLTALGLYDAIFTLTVIINTLLRISCSSVPWLASVCACLWTYCVFTSSYVIICVTAERSLSIAKPFMMQNYRSRGLAIKINLAIATIGVIVNIPGILDEILDLSADGYCQMGINTIQITSFGRVYTLFISVPLNFVVPFFTVLVMNVVFVFAIVAFRRRMRQQLAMGNMPKTETYNEGLVRIVMAVSTWYAVCWLVPGFYYVYKLPMSDVIYIDDETKLAAYSDTLIVANSAINVIFYFLLWRQFRQACVTSFKHLRWRKRKKTVANFHFKSKTRALNIASYHLANPGHKATTVAKESSQS